MDNSELELTERCRDDVGEWGAAGRDRSMTVYNLQPLQQSSSMATTHVTVTDLKKQRTYGPDDEFITLGQMEQGINKVSVSHVRVSIQLAAHWHGLKWAATHGNAVPRPAILLSSVPGP